MPEIGGCRRCTVGVPIAIATDENGTTRRCLNCNAQWTEPASEDARREELTGVDETLSQGDLRALARSQGLDPDRFRTRESLADALERQAEQPTPQQAPPPESAAAAGQPAAQPAASSEPQQGAPPPPAAPTTGGTS